MARRARMVASPGRSNPCRRQPAGHGPMMPQGNHPPSGHRARPAPLPPKAAAPLPPLKAAASSRSRAPRRPAGRPASCAAEAEAAEAAEAAGGRSRAPRRPAAAAAQGSRQHTPGGHCARPAPLPPKAAATLPQGNGRATASRLKREKVGALLCAERVPARARLGDVRVVDLEPRAHKALNVVDAGSLEVVLAAAVDE